MTDQDDTVDVKKRMTSRSKRKRPSRSTLEANNYIQCSEDGADSIKFLKELNFKYEIYFERNEVVNLFIQDKVMEEFYRYNPAFVCIDILCEIPELGRFLVLFIGVDSNGHCEIISLGLIKGGDVLMQGFIWTCDMFKKYNRYWTDIEYILSDGNSERKVFLQQAFPKKIIFTSFYHCLKAFKKDLSSLGNINDNEVIGKILQVFEKMMFVTSETEYSELQKQMKQLNLQVFNLFKRQWHVKRDLWALGLYTESIIFSKVFNTYLLSIRRKIKPVISSQETVEKVIRNLHSAISKSRNEWFHQITKMINLPSASYLKLPLMLKYVNFVTPFAVELIYEQLKKAENIKNIHRIDRQSSYKINENLVNSYSCSCNFHKFMKLPCCHILLVRKHLHLSQFVQSIRPTWILGNYFNVFFSLYHVHALDREETRAVENSRRYEEYVRIFHKLWNQIFNCSESVSQERMEIFQNIIKSWKNSFEISIVRSERRNDSSNADNIENLPTDSFKELYGISINDIIDSENEFMDVTLLSDEDIDII